VDGDRGADRHRATAAGLTAAALGLSSPYWAASTAVSVQLGTDARATRARALQRAVGTALGVLVAGALVWADLPVAVEVLIVAVLQLAVELLIAHQYVLAVACITPLVLLLVHIGAPGLSGAHLVGERLAETGIGVVLALAVGLSLLPRAASRRLPGAVRATTEAARAAVRTAPGGAADTRLREALVQQGRWPPPPGPSSSPARPPPPGPRGPGRSPTSAGAARRAGPGGRGAGGVPRAAAPRRGRLTGLNPPAAARPLQVVEHQPGTQRADRQEPPVVADLERAALLHRGQPLPQPAGGDLRGGPSAPSSP
jgi:hypothetical protein